ncbi:MAG: alpha/beta fold hydrolase, partial [Nocardioides sp.]
VLRVVDDVLTERGEVGQPFFYAGDSVGGAVGLQLALDVPDRVASAVLLCTGARIGDAGMWAGRMGQVSVSGTPVMVSGSAERWFGPGFLDREPARASALLNALRETDDEGYVQVCAALAEFDVRDRLAEIDTPVLAVAGAADVATSTDKLREIADGVADGRLVVLDGVAHLAPAEVPETVARLVREHLLGEIFAEIDDDRVSAATTELTSEFQELIAQYAVGSIESRPGLDRRSRSLITLTALVARGHHEELAPHLRAALTNGLSIDEIKELLLQTAIYCGVPDANKAFRIAREVLAEEEGDDA